MTPTKIKKIFERFESVNPNPKTELQYANLFELLVAVVLSAQATDKSVNLATKSLFKVANTPEKMLALGEEGLKEYIKSIGLYKTKAKNVIKTCEKLISEFNGNVPGDRESLESLPGVGRKTANVILNTAFDQPTLAVDTHVFRVANRTKIAEGKTPAIVEEKLLKAIPKPFLKHAGHWLILHGRYTCVARKPKCPECIIQDLCEFPDKTR